MKKAYGVKNLREMGVDPNGIMYFRGGPGDRETHKVKACLDELRDPIPCQSHPAGDKPNLRSFLLNQPDALREVFVKQGFPPTFENDGLDLLQTGKESFEILKSHILELPMSAFRSDAHPASERTSRRQFNLPC
jgi:hypothetical protein